MPRINRDPPETPSALRAYARKAHVGEAERARIGLGLLVAKRLEGVELALCRVLDVLLKGGSQ